jgi:hypothetical protein
LIDSLLNGWWHKLSVFEKNLHGLSGDLLFIDLDIVITDNLDALFTYKAGEFVIIRDIVTKGYNSSVFRFTVGSQSHVWDSFQGDAENITARLHGDQDWITECIKDAVIWPDNWVVSFKKQCNSRMNRTHGRLGEWLRTKGFMKPTGFAELPKGTKIVQFHGKPDPEDVKDSSYGIYKEAPWINDYWY